MGPLVRSSALAHGLLAAALAACAPAGAGAPLPPPPIEPPVILAALVLRGAEHGPGHEIRRRHVGVLALLVDDPGQPRRGSAFRHQLEIVGGALPHGDDLSEDQDRGGLLTARFVDGLGDVRPFAMTVRVIAVDEQGRRSPPSAPLLVTDAGVERPTPVGAGADEAVAACDHGDASSCVWAAKRYQHGFGVATDPARATKLYLRGCELGSAYACLRVNAGSAHHELTERCEAGDAAACRIHAELGACRIEGPRYEHACQLGDTTACYWMPYWSDLPEPGDDSMLAGATLGVILGGGVWLAWRERARQRRTACTLPRAQLRGPRAARRVLG